MKILLGQVFGWTDPPSPAIWIKGIGTLNGIKDKDFPIYNCIVLNRKQLIQLKKVIEEELDMKGKKVNPFDKREEKNDAKAFAQTENTVKPVAKDTNKTRRKRMKPTKGKVK